MWIYMRMVNLENYVRPSPTGKPKIALTNCFKEKKLLVTSSIADTWLYMPSKLKDIQLLDVYRLQGYIYKKYFNW